MDRTFSHASKNQALVDLERLHFRLGCILSSSPAGSASDFPWSARPLGSSPITGPSSLLRAGPSLCPASVLCPSRLTPLGVLPLATRGSTTPISTGRQHRDDWFSCSVSAPATNSRHLYTGHHQASTQATAWLRARAQVGAPLSRELCDPPLLAPSFRLSMRQQWFTHVRLLVAHLTGSRPAFSATLTTPALNRRSLRWFGIPACTANPEGLPPSLTQHGSCWWLLPHLHSPFRTHRMSPITCALPYPSNRV